MPRKIAIGIIVGIIYYYVMTFFVGIVAAIAWPSWYTSFAAENKILSLLIWDFITVVAAIVVVSSVFGFAISRLVSSSFLLTGFVAVIANFAYFIVLEVSETATGQSIVRSLVPSHAYQIPIYVALYFSLPMASWYLGSRAKVARELSANDAESN